MATKEVSVGSVGPFQYDDTQFDGIETTGVVSADELSSNNVSLEAGTSDVRLIESNSSKDLQEVDLVDYVTTSAPLDASDDGSGGVSISRSPNSSETSLTDNSGGSSNGSVASVSGSGADSTINNNFAELASKLNSLINALQSENVIN